VLVLPNGAPATTWSGARREPVGRKLLIDRDFLGCLLSAQLRRWPRRRRRTVVRAFADLHDHVLRPGEPPEGQPPVSAEPGEGALDRNHER
jgi:hypothetical protein